VLAAVVAAALVLISPLSAAADTVPFPPLVSKHDVVGRIDSLTFVAGEGVVATGWVIDTSRPTDKPVLQFQWGAADGTTGWAGGGPEWVSRPDVGQAYPGAGDMHGFRDVLGFWPGGSPLKVCAEASFEVFSCDSITVTPEAVSGHLETADFALVDGRPVLRVRGWTTDSWSSHGTGSPSIVNSIDYTMDYSPFPGQENAPGTYPYGTFHTIRSGSSRLDRPDVRAAHPELVGVAGIDDALDAQFAGVYRICGTPRLSHADWPGTTESLGCLTAEIHTLTGGPRTLTGTAEPGGILSLSASPWTPRPVTDEVSWTRTGTGTLPDYDESRSVPVTLADVGHTFTVREHLAADGLLPIDSDTTSDTVALPGVTTKRLTGEDRYAVSVATSKDRFRDAAAGAPVVYVASGEKFADALAAGPAAVAEGGPLLLTPAGALPEIVAAEIRRLHPASIVVVGGPASVSDAVKRSLSTLAPTERVGGADRYAVSRNLLQKAFGGTAPRVYLATGTGYADALPAGAAAAAQGLPVLLTDGSAARADAATRDALAVAGTTAVTVIGGPASLSAGVASSLGDGIAVDRLSGADRYSGAVALNKAVFTEAGTVYLATGTNFPDGLTGSARAGASAAPLYLSDGTCVPVAVLEEIVRLKATKVVLLGGWMTLGPLIDDLYAC
jgi:putative cell wall-binding protein